VRGLCELVGESPPILVEDLAERLRVRLELARKAERERDSLVRDLAEAQSRQRASSEQQRVCETTLERLCREAGGVAIADLPACEARADQARELTRLCAKLNEQLVAGSSGNVEALRERLAGQDARSIEAERERLKAEIAGREVAVAEARQIEERTRRALEVIDTSDRAAMARESMEAAAERMRSAVRPWARLRLAHVLLREALNRFRERAQAPMIAAASTYFSLMTGGAFSRLVADEIADKPVLRVEAMSEGTRDQLYLALRLAALELRRGSHPDMPLVLDDVLITSDDARTAHILRALRRFAADSQVVIFTHHRHLIDVVSNALPDGACAVHLL
jgi:DNA repair protein SbcC/Rad50